MTDEVKKRGYWHWRDGCLAEFTTESIESRREYVRAYKPPAEREVHFRLLRPMSPQAEQLLAEYEKVRQSVLDEYCRVTSDAFDEHARIERAAWAEYWRVMGDARAELERIERIAHIKREKALQPLQAELEARHKRECPNCPWDGKTIFAEKQA